MITIKTDKVFADIFYDGLNFIVQHKKLVDDPKSKNHNKEINDGRPLYFSNAKAMTESINSKMIGEAIKNGVVDLVPYINKLTTKLTKQIDKIIEEEDEE